MAAGCAPFPSRSLRGTAALVSALLCACVATPDATRDLPELPADLAKDLAPARSVPVLMTSLRLDIVGAPVGRVTKNEKVASGQPCG